MIPRLYGKDQFITIWQKINLYNLAILTRTVVGNCSVHAYDSLIWQYAYILCMSCVWLTCLTCDMHAINCGFTKPHEFIWTNMPLILINMLHRNVWSSSSLSEEVIKEP